MGPVALLVFKTSEPANNGLVGSTPTRLRHPSSKPPNSLDEGHTDAELAPPLDGEWSAMEDDQK